MYDQNVTPTSDFNPQGPIGGPFSPTNKVYTVYSGSAGGTLTVSDTASVTWLNYSATSVSLPSCGSTAITVSCNTNAANALAAGNYQTTIVFSNATTAAVIQTVNAQLTVGGVYFCDDFSTFTQNSQLAGQNGWIAHGSGGEPMVSNNAVYLTAVTSGGGSGDDEPAKVISQTTSKSGFLYAGIVVTITSAPPVTTTSPSRMTCFFTTQNGTGNYAIDYLGVRDTGTNQFVFGGRNPFTWYFDTTPRNYGTKYQVIIQADPGVTNMYVWVNPASPTVTTNVANIDLNNAGDTGSDFGIGSFSIQNAFGGGSDTPGAIFYKICITTNFADTYNATLPVTAIAPSASFGAVPPTSGVEPFSVTFTNLSTGTAPVTAYWTFGDGGSATNTGANVTHTYAAGTYTVSLLASNSVGTSTATSNNLISVITVWQSWDTHYFPGGGPSAAGSADPLGKGISNTNQFLASFSPTSAAAYPHVISIVKSGANMNVTYLAANGDNTWAPGIATRTNVLEVTTGSPTGNYSNNAVWVSIVGGTNILSGGNGLGSIQTGTDSGGATGATRYYRVRVIAP